MELKKKGEVVTVEFKASAQRQPRLSGTQMATQLKLYLILDYTSN